MYRSEVVSIFKRMVYWGFQVGSWAIGIKVISLDGEGFQEMFFWEDKIDRIFDFIEIISKVFGVELVSTQKIIRELLVFGKIEQDKNRKLQFIVCFN